MKRVLQAVVVLLAVAALVQTFVIAKRDSASRDKNEVIVASAGL